MTADLPDVTLVITGAERATIAGMLATAELAMTFGPVDAEHDSLHEIVDYLTDMQVGSETSDFVFPMPEPPTARKLVL